MNRVKSWWKPMLVGALLMATLVGVVGGARPSEEVNVSATKKVAITANDCIPLDGAAYFDDRVCCNTSLCHLMCPVNVPYHGKYKITSFTMFAYDDGTGNADLALRKNTPSETGSTSMGEYTTVNSSDSPQAVSGPLNKARVQPKHDVYIWLAITGTQAMVYGFELNYRPL